MVTLMAKQPELRSFYRPHRRVTFDNLYLDPTTGEYAVMPSMTKQEFQFECDINNVIKQFKPHQMVEMLRANLASGMYSDLPDSYDYQEALHLVKDADKMFLTVPSKVRERFGHDPAAFLAFTQNSANLSELRQLGLAQPEAAPPAPVEVKIINPPKTTEPPKGGSEGA